MSALKELLNRAARHPWYQNNHGGDRLSDWLITSKAELQARLAQAREGSGGRAGVYYSRSGGTSSGRPLYFPVDGEENHEQSLIAANVTDHGPRPWHHPRPHNDGEAPAGDPLDWASSARSAPPDLAGGLAGSFPCLPIQPPGSGLR
jgi:hypothetical protein